MRTWTDEELKDAVASSFNIADVQRKLGMKANGGNYITVKNYIKLLNLDISHFTFRSARKPRTNASILEVFVENNQYAGTALRRKIKKYNLIEYKCAKCNNVGEWNGQELTLQLDHINGVNDDNRLGNLRFLCPNCHSQTPTYAKATNKGWKAKSRLKIEKQFVEKTCSNCGDTFSMEKRLFLYREKLGYKNFYCNRACAKIAQHKTDHNAVYKRYLELKSFRATAKEFKISDVAVRGIVLKIISSTSSQ